MAVVAWDILLGSPNRVSSQTGTYPASDGDLHEGKHEALVSRSVFERVQKVIARRSKPRAPKLKPFLYRGMFRCDECGCFITTETQKGTNYLRCTKRVKRDCLQPYVRESVVSEQITEALYRLSLPDDIADWLVENLKSRESAFHADLQLKAAELRVQASALDTKIERLTEAYLAQAIALDEYRAMRNRLIADKQLIAEKTRASEGTTHSRFEPAIRFVNRSKQARILAETGSEAEKRDFLRNTGSNLRLSTRNLHWEPRGAWQLVAELVADQACFAHQQPAAPITGAAGVTGETSPDLHFSLKRRGWDSNPRVGRAHYRFSRPARSTALAPLPVSEPMILAARGGSVNPLRRASGTPARHGRR